MVSPGGFKIGWVAIEGFKGFTTRQEIRLDGKHLFVLGPNGYGKSSVIEAIRWGLFGSLRRPNEVIANQTYTGPCRVEIGLDRSGQQLRLRRTLIRGASGGSDSDLTDAAGNPLSIRDVLPQFDSVPAGEGMHIVYTAQSAPLRRMPEDLLPFARTIYAYLGLSDIPLTLAALDRFLRDQEDAENEIGNEITAKRSEIEVEIGRHEQRRDAYIANPPWGEGSVPDIQATEARIRQFYREIEGSDMEMEADLRGLLEEAVEALTQANSQGTEELEARRQQLQSETETVVSLLSGVRTEYEAFQTTSQSCESAKSILHDTLHGQTIEDVANEFERAQEQIQQTNALHRLHEQAHSWLEDSEEGAGSACPVCQRPSDRLQVLSLLSQSLNNATSEEQEASQQLDTLREQVELVKEFQSTVERLEERLSEARKTLDQMCQDAEPMLGRLISFEQIVPDLTDFNNELEESLRAVQTEVEERESVQGARQRQFDSLQDEVHYHNTLTRLRVLQSDLKEIERVEIRLSDLTTFGTGVRGVRDHVEIVLTEKLRQAAPEISEAMTKAFRALTDHPVYDRLYIDDAQLPQLHMLVASTGDSFPGLVPSEVLNGQAINALELVPYFAFSDLDTFPFEVHLLLLDDPTQSFDPQHIEILLERLAELGKRVQLVVASHEMDHFVRLIPKSFDNTVAMSLIVQGFARQSGPVLTHG